MSLKQYLDRLRSYPDGKIEKGQLHPGLRSEFGIQNNYPILFDSNGRGLKLEERPLVRALIGDLETRSYITVLSNEPEIFLAEPPSGSRELILGANRSAFRYILEHLQFLGERRDKLGNRARKHLERQRSYDTYIKIHTPNRAETDLSTQEMRQIADRTIELCDLLKGNRIPFCLPFSQGWNHNEDLSRIVYYTPRTKK